VHEDGISTPFIVHWPAGIKASGKLRHAPAQLADVMATIVEITGVEYPQRYDGHDILPMAGHSLLSLFEQDDPERPPMFWEHEGNSAVRMGRWKRSSPDASIARDKKTDAT